MSRIVSSSCHFYQPPPTRSESFPHRPLPRPAGFSFGAERKELANRPDFHLSSHRSLIYSIMFKSSSFGKKAKRFLASPSSSKLSRSASELLSSSESQPSVGLAEITTSPDSPTVVEQGWSLSPIVLVSDPHVSAFKMQSSTTPPLIGAVTGAEAAPLSSSPQAVPPQIPAPQSLPTKSAQQSERNRITKNVASFRTLLAMSEKALDGLPIWGPKAALSTIAETLRNIQVSLICIRVLFLC
jgi:hypothetical protein